MCPLAHARYSGLFAAGETTARVCPSVFFVESTRVGAVGKRLVAGSTHNFLVPLVGMLAAEYVPTFSRDLWRHAVVGLVCHESVGNGSLAGFLLESVDDGDLKVIEWDVYRIWPRYFRVSSMASLIDSAALGTKPWSGRSLSLLFSLSSSLPPSGHGVCPRAPPSLDFGLWSFDIH